MLSLDQGNSGACLLLPLTSNHLVTSSSGLLLGDQKKLGDNASLKHRCIGRSKAEGGTGTL